MTAAYHLVDRHLHQLHLFNILCRHLGHALQLNDVVDPEQRIHGLVVIFPGLSQFPPGLLQTDVQLLLHEQQFPVVKQGRNVLQGKIQLFQFLDKQDVSQLFFRVVPVIGLGVLVFRGHDMVGIIITQQFSGHITDAGHLADGI